MEHLLQFRLYVKYRIFRNELSLVIGMIINKEYLLLVNETRNQDREKKKRWNGYHD